MSRVSASGRMALEHLADGPMNDGAAIFRLGPARKRILRALKDRGLARYFATPEHWRITPAGRALLGVHETALTVECPECSGQGTVPAACEVCSVALTEQNVEPGTDDLCAPCARLEEAKQ